MNITIHESPCKINEQDIILTFNKLRTLISIYNVCGITDLKPQNIIIDIYGEEEMIEEFGSLTLVRGYIDENRIVLFDTRYETKESLLFAIAHEIVHHIQKNIDPTICAFMELLNRVFFDKKGLVMKPRIPHQYSNGYQELYRQDDIHEAVPMEIMANDIATFVIGKDMGRTWWRENIIKVDSKNKEGTHWYEFFKNYKTRKKTT